MPAPTAAPCCHRCGAPLPAERPSRRDTCARCGSDVRACRNCSFFAPGSHNDCREPMAEAVPDKERANFCEHFALAAAATADRADGGDAARAALDALFRRA
jgi:hypothetical protein